MTNENNYELLAKSIERTTCKFVQIPGPNPILTPGPAGSWDEGVIEACDIFKDHDTYYLYYHGTSKHTFYQIGVATSSSLLGPWEKYEANPILSPKPENDRANYGVACAAIMKEGTDRYYMWYSESTAKEYMWNVNLAVAPNPLGPWKKHEKNPIIQDFGYVGGVVKVDGTYYMYNEYPIGSTGTDYGPISRANAKFPQGPWIKADGRPILSSGPSGSWDDGGFSEAKVTYREGIFHLFYGGAKLHPTRMLTQESIGYAYSFDGHRFTKHPANPIAPRENNPDAAAFAEVHAYFEHPFIYLFHTLRYNSRDGAEDLGVQILATQRPFRLNVPVLLLDNIEAGRTTSLDDCPPVALDNTSGMAITAECTYHLQAKAGLKVYVKASGDGLAYDTEVLYHIDIPCKPGEKVCMTCEFSPKVRFIKLLLENPDDVCPVGTVNIFATLVG